MKSIIIKIMIFCFYLVFFFPINAEEIDLSKEYYIDLAGYHAIGKRDSDDKEEATRLAKSDAIKRIFSEIGKDELFQQMFISAMPQFIIIEAEKSEKIDNKFHVIIKLNIDQNAVIIMEESYTHAVIELLNTTEKISEEIEVYLKNAENAELNLRMSEALLFYRSAKLRCREIDDLLKNVSDSSIKSAKGNNIIILDSITNNFYTRASEGFTRLEEIEMAMEKDSTLNELIKTFELLLNEINNIESVIIKNSEIQPFYDLEKNKLEDIRIDINNAIDKSKVVYEKLIFLSNQIPEERLLLKEKIAIAIDELDWMSNKLNKMKKDVDLEIFDPRLVRQQRAQNWKQFAQITGDFCTYLFFHNSEDILALRYYLPFEWIVDSNIEFSRGSEFYIRVEKAFTSGFWIKSQFNNMNTFLINNNMNSAIFQELALGYFRERFFFAAGFTWDWERKINSTPIDKDTILKIYFGGVNSSHTRADWLLSFSYRFPQFLNPFFYAYQLNGALDLIVRIENILLLETSVSSTTFQDSISVDNELRLENLQYGFNWRLGLGLRFPGPFVWGVYYNYNSSAFINPLTEENDFGNFQSKNHWGGYIEYSF